MMMSPLKEFFNSITLTAIEHSLGHDLINNIITIIIMKSFKITILFKFFILMNVSHVDNGTFHSTLKI